MTELEARAAARAFNDAAREAGRPADAVAVPGGRARPSALPSPVWRVLHGPLDYR